jgi:outer membrane protein assembly factor BamD (BamD/ComL family)
VQSSRSYRHLFLFILALLSFGLGSTPVFAQNAKPNANAQARERQRITDSTQAARKAILESERVARAARMDSTRNAQKALMDANRDAQKAKTEAMRAAQSRALDSTKNIRQHNLDSIKNIRQQRTDSLTRIRKYRESKRFKDSVAKSRLQKTNALRATQQAKTDSLKAIRKKSTDSMMAIRKHSIDSVRAIQKRRTDSMGVIRKYRESKRFRDSVTIFRKVRMDSLKASRKAFTDSMFAARKHILDSSKTERKRVADSATAVRKKITDSLTSIRTARADSLAKKKLEREKQAKAKEKKQQSILDMKMEVKIKAKRKKFTNETMLKKKWILPRQVLQNTFTRYNYYFNARRKMDEAELNMQRIAKDNFDNRIDLFSFDPNRDSTVLAADMDSVIRKASIGLQIHDPRTKWGDDLYLLLGQAYHFKGDYENANAAFRYIVAMRAKEKQDKAKKDAFKNSVVRGGKREAASVVEEDKKKFLDFLKHESANNEALLWVARNMTQSGKLEEAESVLDLLSHDAKFPEALKGRLALELAFLDLKQKNNRSAAEHLVVVADDKSQPYFIRRRASFLSGQLLQEDRKYELAATQFDRVSGLQPKLDMDFYARKNKAYSLMLAGGDQNEAIASLKYMLNDGKYATYNEQIYYILGRLSINTNNTKDAETYLKKSLASAKSTKRQKASSFALLGNIYYNVGNWDAAKLAYDSAASFSSHAMDDDAVVTAKQRSAVLDQVAMPERTIRTQDSLLALGAMTEKEQRAIVRRYIRQLQQRREDSAFRAQAAAENPTRGNDADGGNTQGAMSWYFANPTLMQQGVTEFKRKWGNRPLVDNWQRSAAIANIKGSNVTSSGDPNTMKPENADGSTDEDGLPSEESLLAAIPSTQQQKDAATRLIQRAYVDLGSAYVKALEDYPRAGRALDTLDKRYRTHPFVDEALYTRYLLALRQNDLPKAQLAGKRLQDEFPASKWTEMVKPSSDGNSEAGAQATVAGYYEETYSLLQERRYADALSHSRTGRQRYNNDSYSKRFQVVEGMALAGNGRYRQADTLLSEFIRLNQNDSLRTWAEQVLKYVKQQIIADSLARPKQLPDSVANAAKTVTTTTTTTPGITNQTTLPGNGTPADSSRAAVIPIPMNFTYNANEEHCFIFYFKTGMSPKVMGVKAGLTDFNSIKFSGQQLIGSIEMLQPADGLIIVRRFANAGQARIYMNEFKRTPNMTREFTANEYQALIISSSNLLKLTTDKNMPAYLNFYKGRY